MLPPSQPMTMPPNQSSQQNPNMFMFPSTSMPSESFTALMSRNPSQMHHSMQMPMAMPMSLPMMPSHVHTTQSPTHNYSHAMALAVNLFANSSPATSSMGMPGRHTTHSTNMNMLPKMSTSLPRGSHVEENRTLVGHSTSSMDASLLQASLEHPEAPNLLKQYQLEWRNCNEKRRDIDNEPVSTIEKQLQPLIDSKCRVHSLVDVETFLAIVQAAKTETEQAFVLVILRATTQLASSASSEQKRLAKATARGFEKNGGLKLARSWIEKGVDNNHRDLLVLLLDVLRHLPLRLSSITDARINEPIVKLKKTARDEIVKKSAQELLKYWRARFTEKEMARTANLSSAKVSSELSNLSSSSPVGTSATSIPTAPRISHRPIASAKAISNSKAHLLSRDSAINLKKRAVKIKHLEQLPFNGGTSVSKTSSDLIDNLKQRNAVKEVTASTNSSTNSSKANNENAALNESCSAANENKSVTVPSDNNPKNEQDVAMQLPAIQSFGSVSKSVSKKIRWADEQGEELVRVQLIESWRDHLPSTAGMNDESFQHAKLREHADERNALQSQKQRVHIQATHEWYTPPLIQLPEAIATRLQSPVKTEEYKGQTARTRHEMEYLVLDGETPQASPKEWTRGVNERNQSGPPVPIPLSEIVHDDEGFPPTEERIGDGNEEHVTDNKTTLEDDDDRDYGEELEEEAALRDALGPLKRSTIALLIENEDSLPQICEEAQRNGNRISDARILDIIAGKQMRNHNGYSSMPHPPAGYYHTHGPPTVGYHPYAQGAISHRMPRPYPDQIPLKRKLPGSMGPNGGGILADAPPPFKRLMRKGPAALTCMYHYSPAGCKHGAGCQYSHDVPPGPYPQSLNEVQHPNNMNGMHPPISHFEPGRMGFQGPANHRQMRR